MRAPRSERRVAARDRRVACATRRLRRRYFGVRDEFTHGGPLTETVLVGAMADHHASEWLDWDRTALKFTNHAKATALVRRAYRDGWQVPGLG